MRFRGDGDATSIGINVTRGAQSGGSLALGIAYMASPSTEALLRVDTYRRGPQVFEFDTSKADEVGALLLARCKGAE